MSFNISELKIGGDLVEGQTYVWRVVGMAVVESKSGNLRWQVNCEVAEGDATGQTAPFQPFKSMLYDVKGQNTTKWILQTLNLFQEILGVSRHDPDDQDVIEQLQHIPTEPGEKVPANDLLLNAMFEAEAVWQEPSGNYPGRWFVGDVIRPVVGVEVDPLDWDTLFDR